MGARYPDPCQGNIARPNTSLTVSPIAVPFARPASYLEGALAHIVAGTSVSASTALDGPTGYLPASSTSHAHLLNLLPSPSGQPRSGYFSAGVLDSASSPASWIQTIWHSKAARASSRPLNTHQGMEGWPRRRASTLAEPQKLAVVQHPHGPSPILSRWRYKPAVRLATAFGHTVAERVRAQDQLSLSLDRSRVGIDVCPWMTPRRTRHHTIQRVSQKSEEHPNTRGGPAILCGISTDI